MICNGRTNSQFMEGGLYEQPTERGAILATIRRVISNSRGVVLALPIGWAILAGASSSAASSYDYSVVQYPGASQTAIRGLNNVGTVVGGYDTASGNFGFEEAGGVFTSLGLGYLARGVNDLGEVVGRSPNGDGFIYSAGSFTLYDAPGSTATVISGINNAGDFVGRYGNGTGDQFGFADVGGVFATITPPNSTTVPGSINNFPTDINNNGEIVGYYTATNGVGYGFTDINGVFSNVYVPGSNYTGLLGVNDNGTVAGFYGTASGSELPFIESDGVYTLLSVPGQTTDTDATGINNDGSVVGYNTLTSGLYEGYVGTLSAAPEPSTWVMMLLGVLGLGASLRTRRRFRGGAAPRPQMVG
jgi:hypothetical protein